MPRLIANNITIPREVQNDCDPGDPRRLQRDSTLVLRHTGRPYYTYDLHGADWTATFVVVDLDSDCFVKKYQASTSVYQNSYTKQCHAERATQVAFLEQTFAASKAEWKFLQLHHGYMSAATNNTDVAPLIAVVEKHGGVVLNGHDHCLAHFYNNNTNFILSGGAGYPHAGDCNYGLPLGPLHQVAGGKLAVYC
ncbi:purple acid phosphatase 4 [Aspergillus lentulus]|nr:purple acid phosphatase 4 [Aspergillus lentulus]